MDRTDRELAAWYRLCARQAPSGPLRDISDPLDFLKFVQMREWGNVAAERSYREFRVIPKRRPAVALASPQRTPRASVSLTAPRRAPEAVCKSLPTPTPTRDELTRMGWDRFSTGMIKTILADSPDLPRVLRACGRI